MEELNKLNEELLRLNEEKTSLEKKLMDLSIAMSENNEKSLDLLFNCDSVTFPLNVKEHNYIWHSIFKKTEPEKYKELSDEGRAFVLLKIDLQHKLNIINDKIIWHEYRLKIGLDSPRRYW